MYIYRMLCIKLSSIHFENPLNLVADLQEDRKRYLEVRNIQIQKQKVVIVQMNTAKDGRKKISDKKKQKKQFNF